MQFGRLHPAAVPIYEVKLKWSTSVYYMDYVDEKPNGDKQNFIINLILVLEESTLDSPVETEIIQGGVGFNFTTLRLSCLHYDGFESRNAQI
ncbi:hypothetical protein ACLKA6_001985 [Drosophila palustris]